MVGKRQANDELRRLEEELERLGRIPLVICDEVGYIRFDPEAAALNRLRRP
jgi:hypothetical protein